MGLFIRSLEEPSCRRVHNWGIYSQSERASARGGMKVQLRFSQKRERTSVCRVALRKYRLLNTCQARRKTSPPQGQATRDILRSLFSSPLYLPSANPVYVPMSLCTGVYSITEKLLPASLPGHQCFLCVWYVWKFRAIKPLKTSYLLSTEERIMQRARRQGSSMLSSSIIELGFPEMVDYETIHMVANDAISAAPGAVPFPPGL